MRALKGLFLSIAFAALILWLIGNAFYIDVPVTWRSVAAVWALMVICMLLVKFCVHSAIEGYEKEKTEQLRKAIEAKARVQA